MPCRKQWLPFLNRPLVPYLHDTLPPKILVLHLLATGFITGILDATTYVDFGAFTSNQTGNSILLGIGLIKVTHINLLDTGTSLGSFLVSAVIFGQCGVLVHGRTRWWVLLTSLYQAITVLIVPTLAYRHVISITKEWSWVIILLLASSAGAQVTMAKQFSIPEIPTAMLTSPFVSNYLALKNYVLIASRLIYQLIRISSV